MIERGRAPIGAVSVLLGTMLASRGRLDAQTPPAPPVDRIVVTVTGLRSDAGLVGVALYGPASRWPEPHGFLGDCDARIVHREATCVLTGMHPGGFFAVAISHDENANGRFDQGFLGIPLEGYGFSNDAHPILSAPSFNACRFFYRGGEMTVRIRAQY